MAAECLSTVPASVHETWLACRSERMLLREPWGRRLGGVVSTSRRVTASSPPDILSSYMAASATGQ